MTLPAEVLVRDVTLRDGLQDERVVATDEKVELYEALVAAGVAELELVSFVRPDRVPAMADAEELAARTVGDGPARWALVLNLRGATRALSSGLRHLQFVVSVSDAHNSRNAGRSVDESFAELSRICAVAAESGAVIEITLATAFGCPYAGEVVPAAVLAAADRAVSCGVTAVGFADTIGTAVPTEVAALVDAFVRAHPSLPAGVHLHDTRGLAIANAIAAVESGAVRVDGSVGGLGGCPFAPGASGNLPLEDLVHAFEHMGVRTGINLGLLIEAAQLACRIVGREVGSHVGVAGPRFAGVGEQRA